VTDTVTPTEKFYHWSEVHNQKKQIKRKTAPQETEYSQRRPAISIPEKTSPIIFFLQRDALENAHENHIN
jgi:hypothetical protein